MKKWVQIDFSMRSGSVITTGWEETKSDLEGFNPFAYVDDLGKRIDVDIKPGQFVGFESQQDPQAMEYVQVVEVESFLVTMVEEEKKPE